MHPIDLLFLVCALLGGGYMVATILMGGLSHAAGHVAHGGGFHGLHVGHGDAGGHGAHAANGGAGHAAHSGHAEAGGHAHGHGHDADNSGDSADPDDTPSRFSFLPQINPMLLSGFLLGFGGIALASRGMHFGHGPAALAGAMGGVMLYWVASLIVVRVFGNAQGTSHNRREDLAGLRGLVTAPIDGQRPGMICYVVMGTRQSMRAVTEDGVSIPAGAAVILRRVEGSTAYVTPLDAMSTTPLHL